MDNNISYNSPPNTSIIQEKIINSPSPTNIPSLTPTPTSSPTPTTTPVPEVQPTKSLDEPESTEPKDNIPEDTSGNSGLNLMQQINNFRASKGLSSLSTDGYTCAFATQRAGEIVDNFNHDGFRQRIDSNTLPYPSYSNVAENIALNPVPGDVVQAWIDSPGHNENMSKDVPYGCVGMNGQYFVFQAWKP